MPTRCYPLAITSTIDYLRTSRAMWFHEIENIFFLLDPCRPLFFSHIQEFGGKSGYDVRVPAAPHSTSRHHHLTPPPHHTSSRLLLEHNAGGGLRGPAATFVTACGIILGTVNALHELHQCCSIPPLCLYSSLCTQRVCRSATPRRYRSN